MKVILMAVLVVTLIACSSSNDESEKPKGAVPEHQMKALEKAKGVEQTLLEAEQKRLKSMEEAQ